MRNMHHLARVVFMYPRPLRELQIKPAASIPRPGTRNEVTVKRLDFFIGQMAETAFRNLGHQSQIPAIRCLSRAQQSPELFERVIACHNQVGAKRHIVSAKRRAVALATRHLRNIATTIMPASSGPGRARAFQRHLLLR